MVSSLRGVSADPVRKLRAQLTLALHPAGPGRRFDASRTLLLLDKTIKTESVWEISGTSAISCFQIAESNQMTFDLPSAAT